MKIAELLENRNNNYEDVVVEFEDRQTGRAVQARLRVSVIRDSGDVGGGNIDPNMAGVELDSIEVLQTFVVNGKQYNRGEQIDQDELVDSTGNPDWALAAAEDQAEANVSRDAAQADDYVDSRREERFR